MTNEERTKMIIAHNERIKRELNDTCRNKISSMKCSGIDGVLAGLSFCGAANIDFSYNVLAKIGVFLLSLSPAPAGTFAPITTIFPSKKAGSVIGFLPDFILS